MGSISCRTHTHRYSALRQNRHSYPRIRRMRKTNGIKAAFLATAPSGAYRSDGGASPLPETKLDFASSPSPSSPPSPPTRFPSVRDEGSQDAGGDLWLRRSDCQAQYPRPLVCYFFTDGKRSREKEEKQKRKITAGGRRRHCAGALSASDEIYNSGIDHRESQRARAGHIVHHSPRQLTLIGHVIV